MYWRLFQEEKTTLNHLQLINVVVMEVKSGVGARLVHSLSVFPGFLLDTTQHACTASIGMTRESLYSIVQDYIVFIWRKL